MRANQFSRPGIFVISGSLHGNSGGVEGVGADFVP